MLTPFESNHVSTTAGSGLTINDDDTRAVQDWLEEVATTRSHTTWLNYRKELTRFLSWLAIQQLPLRQVLRQHVNHYQQFLQRPPAELLSKRRTAGMLSGPLKPSSIRQAMTILHNCYDWMQLHDRAGISRNPFRRVRVQKDQTSHFEERMLSVAAIEQINATIAELPRESLRDFHHYYRLRWLLALLLIGGLRREEVVSGRMGDFQYDASYKVWTLRVTGKGNKTRDVTVTEELLAELQYYRQHALNRLVMPDPGEDLPLIHQLNGKGWREPRPMGGDHLYQLVKQLLARAADRATDAGLPHLAEELRKASPHWFRHASITAKLEAGVPIEDVADEHGHININTTQRYAHKRKGLRASRMAGLKLLPTNGSD